MYNEQRFSVKKVANLSPEEFSHLADLSAAAFADDPSYNYLLSSQELIRRLTGTYIKFFHNSGQMYLCVNESGEMCGVSCWVDSTGESMNRQNMKQYGVLKEFRRLVFSLPLR